MKTSVVIPAMNEEKVIGSVVRNVQEVMEANGLEYEILVVDDGSSDRTAHVAAQAGAIVFRHAYNLGNGAAVKTGIRYATGDIVVMMDGDGQHSAHDIPSLLRDIGEHGMVVGARTHDSQTKWYRDVANAVYNLFASYICGRRILDLTSGFRAIHTSLARRFLYLLPNTFSYPTTITLAVLRAGHCVKYVPIQSKTRIGSSKIRLLSDGTRFLIIIFRIATLFSPLKVFLPISIGILGLGLTWYVFTLLTVGQKMPPASVIMILSGVLFFLMGLISEQIAQLRFDRSEDDSVPVTYSGVSVLTHESSLREVEVSHAGTEQSAQDWLRPR